jgi:DNA-binding NarL/FixJ family response regulator
MQLGLLDSRFHKLQELMPFKVREILLLSSAYDAFILEEAGTLSGRLFGEYSELRLAEAPRITHVSTGARALELLASRQFDLVITVVEVADMAVGTFTAKVRELLPLMPVVLLVFGEADLLQCPDVLCSGGVDRVLLWTGDLRILIAGIKLIEDARNLEHDARVGGVRFIIVVEDSIRRYSGFLSILYSELLVQARSLIAEGLNEQHQTMRMRARVKIVLTCTFEEAMEYFDRYQDQVFALISDVSFPREGVQDPNAGFELLRVFRERYPDMPVLLQSAECDAATRAAEQGVAFVDKNSPQLHAKIRHFLKTGLGFGDFIFRDANGAEVGRARDVFEMEQMLKIVPAESIALHAYRNHFSLWLAARSMYPVAAMFRRHDARDFDSIEGLRTFLIRALRAERRSEANELVSDFTNLKRDRESSFVRLISGSIGGKGRGIAFIRSQLARQGFAERYAGLAVRIPKTAGIGTDEFDRFLELSVSREEILACDSDQEVLTRFLNGRLSSTLLRQLKGMTRILKGPLAVRSSSLLEDSRFQPFAGIYSTWMLPNNHPDPAVRLTELCLAIKAVFASTFLHNARAYFSGAPQTAEEEKMAVVIQELVGRRYGDRYYPHMSGVAQSRNFYPVGSQRADDGIALMALGLGHQVVSGGTALRFSPGAPDVFPQFPTARHFLRNSQAQFYALDLSRQTVDFWGGKPESNLRQFDLDTAEADGTLRHVGSVFSASDGRIRDTLREAGPRLVTFHNILKWRSLPLAEALADVLQVSREGLGCDADIEFAVDMGPEGDAPRASEETESWPALNILQLRPMTRRSSLDHQVSFEEPPPDRILCRTTSSLGHGVIRGIHDVVYVTDGGLDGTSTPAIARQIGEINAALLSRQAPYLLIGPGRWGSSDSALGIPVEWSQIAGARIIVETAFGDRSVDPSQGTHFFHNVTSKQIGYLTLSSFPQRITADNFIDLQWLDRQPEARSMPGVRHVHLERPLIAYLDGRKNVATLLKPDPDEEQNGMAPEEMY